MGGRYTPTKTYLRVFNTSIQEQWAKMMPSAPENNMVPRSNHSNTNPFLDPRSTQQEYSNPLLGPGSSQSETTNPFMTRPVVRFSPSVINNSTTQGSIPPFHNPMSNFSSTPVLLPQCDIYYPNYEFNT